MITVDRKELSRALAACKWVAVRSATIPILSNVLIETLRKGKKGKLRLTATDLEVCYRTMLDAKIGQKSAFLLPLGTLADAVRNMEPHETAVKFSRVERDDGGIEIHMNDAAMISNVSVDEWPMVPTMENPKAFEIDGLGFVVRRVVAAASNDDIHYNLCSVYFNMNRGEVVATDGHRLHVVRGFSLDGEGLPEEFLLPVPAARIISRWDGKVDMLLGDGNGLFRTDGGSTELIARFKEAVFPNYREVLPMEYSTSIKLSAQGLHDAVREALPFCSEFLGIRFGISPEKVTFEVSVDSHDVGSNAVSLEIAEYSGNSEPLNLSFNGRYILDVLDAIEEEHVVLEVNDAVSACRVQEGDFSAFVMPMRL